MFPILGIDYISTAGCILRGIIAENFHSGKYKDLRGGRGEVWGVEEGIMAEFKGAYIIHYSARKPFFFRFL